MKKAAAIVVLAAACGAGGYAAGRAERSSVPAERPWPGKVVTLEEVEALRPRDTPTPKDEQRAEVFITRTGTKYHRATCQYARKAGTGVTLAEAERRGLAPCSKCTP